MAKVVELSIIVKLSRLVKDSVDETAVFPAEIEATIEEMVTELIGDPAAVIEVSEITD